MTTVEKIRSILKERRIPVSRLEKELGFSNGYIGQLRKGSMPAERLVKVADYLDVPMVDLLSDGASLLELTAADNGLHAALDVLTGAYEQKNSPVVPDKATLHDDLLALLITLTPDEIEKVDAFVQGLIASRKA